MILRDYKEEDCAALAELFYNTVHSVNARDYTIEQLNAWASGSVDIEAWNKSFLDHHTVVAEIGDVIVGFGDMDDNGYFDRLYVHAHYQHEGVATAIANELERQAVSNGVSRFSTHASITAKPFFEKQGYRVLGENAVIRNNTKLINYLMEKHIDL